MNAVPLLAVLVIFAALLALIFGATALDRRAARRRLTGIK
jgi:hypothetical protein